MLKELEISDPQSCLNKALDGEHVFVLRGKDPCAPAAIRYWASERQRLGINDADDRKIVEALRCADLMAAYSAALAKE